MPKFGYALREWLQVERWTVELQGSSHRLPLVA